MLWRAIRPLSQERPAVIGPRSPNLTKRGGGDIGYSKASEDRGRASFELATDQEPLSRSPREQRMECRVCERSGRGAPEVLDDTSSTVAGIDSAHAARAGASIGGG